MWRATRSLKPLSVQAMSGEAWFPWPWWQSKAARQASTTSHTRCRLQRPSCYQNGAAAQQFHTPSLAGGHTAQASPCMASSPVDRQANMGAGKQPIWISYVAVHKFAAAGVRSHEGLMHIAGTVWPTTCTCAQALQDTLLPA